VASITQGIFARNVEALRSLNGYTQAQVAAFVGVSPAMISRYENAENFCMPTAEAMDKLAELFHVYVADLFTSDTAKLKKAELQGTTQADALFMINKMLADAGLHIGTIPKQKKAS
jgi:transcriptional regulator with XRE-family HTH domain